MDVGRRLESIRNQKGLSQYRLSKITGVSQPYLSGIEAGTKNPTLDKMEQICKGLEITLAQFVSEDTESVPFEIQQLVQKAKTLNPEQLKLLTQFINSLK
jgi:transcriptional regulator with XRE-family HTH domain